MGEVVLNIKMMKSKYRTNIVPTSNIHMGDNEVVNVDSYVYLDHEIRISKHNRIRKVNRRHILAWAAYEKLDSYLRVIFPST